MKNLKLILLLNSALALTCPVIQGNDMLDIAAGVGSAGSVMFWTLSTFIHNVITRRIIPAMGRGAIPPAIESTFIIPRVALDATAATLSFYTPESKRNNTILNVAICAGSALSLVLWGPEIANTVKKYGVIGAIASTHLLRAAIDVAQIVVSARRLHQLANK